MGGWPACAEVAWAPDVCYSAVSPTVRMMKLEAHRCLLSKLSRLVIAMLGSDSFPGPSLMCQTELMIPTIIAKMASLSIY